MTLLCHIPPGGLEHGGNPWVSLLLWMFPGAEGSHSGYPAGEGGNDSGLAFGSAAIVQKPQAMSMLIFTMDEESMVIPEPILALETLVAYH